MQTKDPTASLDVVLEMFHLAALNAWFIDCRQMAADGSKGPILCSSHLWENRNDALSEVTMLMAQLETVET